MDTSRRGWRRRDTAARSWPRTGVDVGGRCCMVRARCSASEAAVRRATPARRNAIRRGAWLQPEEDRGPKSGHAESCGSRADTHGDGSNREAKRWCGAFRFARAGQLSPQGVRLPPRARSLNGGQVPANRTIRSSSLAALRSRTLHGRCCAVFTNRSPFTSGSVERIGKTPASRVVVPRSGTRAGVSA